MQPLSNPYLGAPSRDRSHQFPRAQLGTAAIRCGGVKEPKYQPGSKVADPRAAPVRKRLATTAGLKTG